jgi:hypothetical protein
VIIFSHPTFAADLTASEYELNFTLDHAEEVLSNTINVNTNTAKENSIRSTNIYLENFTLKNSKNKEIPAHYIKVETPYFKDTLEKSYRFLLMKSDQEKSWFKIGLISKAAFLDPGIYEGVINIDGLDWQINIVVTIKPFVNLYLSDRKFEIKITDPSQSDFFIAPNLHLINVESNYTDWEIQGSLEAEFASKEGNLIKAEDLFYRLEEVNQKNRTKTLEKSQFQNFNKKDNSIIITGSDYQRGLKALRFGITLAGEDLSVQPAGIYSGRIIFTLRTLSNN